MIAVAGPRASVFVDLAGAPATSASGAVRRALADPRGVFSNRAGRLKRASGKMFKFARVTLKFAVSRLRNLPTPRSSPGGHVGGLEGPVRAASKTPCPAHLRARAQPTQHRFVTSAARRTTAVLRAPLRCIQSNNRHRNDAAVSRAHRRLCRTPRKCGGPCLPCQSPARLRRAASARPGARRDQHVHAKRHAPLARRRHGRDGGVARHLRVRGAGRPVGLI